MTLSDYIVLKALSFEKRRELKDVYDLVYVILNAVDNPTQLSLRATEEELKEASFHRAIDILKNHFRSISQNGPVKYGKFTDRPENAAIAYAAVQDFLREINQRVKTLQ